MLTLSHFTETLAQRSLDGEQPISDVVDRLEQVGRNTLFVASDEAGHDMIDEAFARGAVAALAERDVPSAAYQVLDMRQRPQIGRAHV